MPSKSMSMPQSKEDAIRTRAYLLWEADGRPDGGAEHYWSVAAAELTVAEKPKRAKAATVATPEKKAKPKAAKAAAKAPAKPKKTKA